MKESIMIILLYYNTTMFRSFLWIPFSLHCFRWNQGGGEACGGCWYKEVVGGYKPSLERLACEAGRGVLLVLCKCLLSTAQYFYLLILK